MAQETSLLNVKIYEVHEAWTTWQGLRATNHAAKTSQRDMQFICVVMPTELPNIMGIKQIHSPKALHWQGSHSYCPWYGKEGQNEDTMINYLRTGHYHLGLVCTLCMEFFSTSVDTMRWHTHTCKSMATEDKDWEEGGEPKSDNDADKDKSYLFEEI